MIKIIIKIVVIMVRVRMFETETIKIIDRSGAISTSKIRKIIVIKKNRSEKGSRADWEW